VEMSKKTTTSIVPTIPTTPADPGTTEETSFESDYLDQMMNDTEEQAAQYEKRRQAEQEYRELMKSENEKQIELEKEKNEKLNEERLAQQEIDKQFIEETLAYRDEVAQRELDEKEKANKDMSAADWARLKDEEAAQSIRDGMKNAQLQLAKDIVDGETKSLAAYASIIAKKLQLEMVSTGIEAGVLTLKEIAFGLASTAIRDEEAAKYHFGAAATFAKITTMAGLGAVAAGSISGGGSSGEIETPTAEAEQEVADVATEEIEEEKVIYISKEDWNRAGFNLIDIIDEAADNGKMIKRVSR